MKEAILKRLGLTGGPLFWITGVFTVVYWTIIIGQFWGGKEFAKVPGMLSEFYITALSAYVGVNLVEKASGNGKKRPGSIFVIGWIILAAVIMILVSFNVHGEEGDLSLFWPAPLMAIIGIYGGSKAVKNTKTLFDKIKEVLKAPPGDTSSSTPGA